MNECFPGRFRTGRDQHQLCRLHGHGTEQKRAPRGESPRDGPCPKGGVCGSRVETGHPAQRDSEPVSLHGRAGQTRGRSLDWGGLAATLKALY